MVGWLSRFAGMVLVVGVSGWLAACAAPTPRSELPTVGYIENTAYVRYTSVWSRHAFDSPRVAARVALVTGEPVQLAGRAAGRTQEDTAAGQTTANVLKADVTADAARAATTGEVAKSGTTDATVRGQTRADQHVGRTQSHERAGRTEQQVASGQTAAEAKSGRTDAAQARGSQTAREQIGTTAGSAVRGRNENIALTGQSDASAVAGRVDAEALRPHLNLRKTASQSHVLPGDRIIFTFHVHNPGPLDAKAVAIIDELPPMLEVVAVHGATLETGEDRDHHLHLAGVLPVAGERTITLDTRVRDTTASLR